MHTQHFIPVDEFCASHSIEMTFISALQETGLIDMTTIKETGCIPANQLPQLEKIVRFHYELDINLEGIETIMHLLQQIYDLQADMMALKNRLRLYEDQEG
ncbi:hypothetical protein U27_03207 [Candidatus Vecturithrix granuli]|uniref:MerR family transcriptional regulator n=1 Tax=Vecturithrix granuli TaxID=1499967 RepID=A0A081BV90_VECG1|nr:hypothetical protein U27_03207 [Candidatus Vecturithrix granuli]